MGFSSIHKSRLNIGFTLLEMLAATAMFAIIVGVLYSVLHGSLQLRQRAYKNFEEKQPREYVQNLLKQDIAGVVAPGGILSGNFTGEKDAKGTQRLDTLELYSSSGILTENNPWGDIQRVEYKLELSEDSEDSQEYDLIRNVTRNLLASTEEETDDVRIVSGVQSLEFSYYDGEDWQDSWDSETEEPQIPEAVHVLIQFRPTEDEEASAVHPLELVTAISVQPAEEEEETQQSQGEQGQES